MNSAKGPLAKSNAELSRLESWARCAPVPPSVAITTLEFDVSASTTWKSEAAIPVSAEVTAEVRLTGRARASATSGASLKSYTASTAADASVATCPARIVVARAGTARIWHRVMGYSIGSQDRVWPGSRL